MKDELVSLNCILYDKIFNSLIYPAFRNSFIAVKLSIAITMTRMVMLIITMILLMVVTMMMTNDSDGDDDKNNDDG